MSYQFIHYEKYKLQDVKGIVGEATREDGFCPHVPHPQAPTVLKGDLAALRAKLEKEVPEYKREMKTTVKGQVKTCHRGLRKDANVLLAGTASYPDPNGRPGDPDFDRWTQLNMKYLDKRYGDQLQAVVLHLDEGYPHLHFYVIPRDYDMTNACPADKASKEQNTKAASAQALRDYQDDYQQQVGIYCGLSRTGPRRRRMTRQEWLDERTANKLASECINKTLAIAGNTKKKNQHLEAELAKAKDTIAATVQRAEEAEMMVAMTTGLGHAPTPPSKDASKKVEHAQEVAPPGVTTVEIGDWGL